MVCTVRKVVDVGTFGMALMYAPGRDRVECKRKGMVAALEVAGAPTDCRPKFPKGRAPELDGAWTLSISHTGPWLLAAAALGSKVHLGVDVERCKPRNFDGIGAFLGWPSPSRDARHFYRRWTLAEALFKAVGRGMHDWFGTFDDATRASTDALNFDRQGWRWHVRWHNLPAEASGSIAGVSCLVMGAPS